MAGCLARIAWRDPFLQLDELEALPGWLLRLLELAWLFVFA
jgi:hypothetical protein